MEELDRAKIGEAFNVAKSKLIFLDFDGTLSPINVEPNADVPSRQIKEVLSKLSADSNTQVLIISGRSREALDRAVGDLSLLLVAEHGGFFREPNGGWIMLFPTSVSWKSRVLPSVYELKRQFRGSQVEEKYYSICWHYRFIKNGISLTEIQRVLSLLQLISNKNEFTINNDMLTIDIRAIGIDKGKFAAQWIGGQKPFDFILAMGDSKTDEDLFEAVGPDRFTVKVGKTSHSAARYYINDQQKVEHFLSGLISKRLAL